MEEGGGGAEEADVEVAHGGAEELLHFLVLPLREELGEVGMQAAGAWGSPVWESSIQLVLLELLVHL